MRYTSPISLLGLPLVEIVLPGPTSAGAAPERPIARAWLAIGPIAIGVVAFGGVASGGMALGGLALGILPIGGLAIGAIAFGGGAVGYWAVGGAAIAANAALGGFAAAADYAMGGAAFARHANDQVAREFFSSGFPFPAFRQLARHSRWFSLLLVLPLCLPFLTNKQQGPLDP